MTGLMDSLGDLIQNSPLIAIAIAFLGGLAASFTPCVYPMIPVTVGYIGASSSNSRSKAFMLSITYVFGMAVTYAALGAFAALTGRWFGQISTNPWIYLFAGNVFLLLGLAMLGVFELQIPFVTKRLNSVSSNKKGLVGAFLVGLTTGTIAAPCTAPVLGVILTFVAAKQNIMYGMLLLFSFSLGMGTLFVVIGTFTGILASLPKSGAWMVHVKKIFGWLILIAAEYFIIQAGRFLSL